MDVATVCDLYRSCMGVAENIIRSEEDSVLHPARENGVAVSDREMVVAVG